MKLFKDLESYDRKPPDKHIVQTVADAYELLGMLDEKERVVTKYSHLLLGTPSDDKPSRSSRKKKKPGRWLRFSHWYLQPSLKPFDIELMCYRFLRKTA